MPPKKVDPKKDPKQQSKKKPESSGGGKQKKKARCKGRWEAAARLSSHRAAARPLRRLRRRLTRLCPAEVEQGKEQGEG